MGRRQRGAACEELEQRQLLAFVWVNEARDTTFSTELGAGAPAARAVVERAVADWNRAIPTFNDGTDDQLRLKFKVASLGYGFFAATDITAVDPVTGRPTAATIWIDHDGGEGGWFIDKTPMDDREFSELVTPYSARATTARGVDLFATVLHEIGHAAGIAAQPGTRIVNDLSAIGDDPRGGTLFVLTVGGQDLALLTDYSGTHVYEGPAPAGYSYIPTYDNDLMNAGRGLEWDLEFPNPGDNTPTRVFPGSVYPAQRFLISPIDLRILHEVYGYTVVMPPEVDSGILYVNGSAAADHINVRVEDGVLTVRREGVPVGRFDPSSVGRISIFGGAGNDTIRIADSVTGPATIRGGAGNDVLYGGGGETSLYGNAGNDVLHGGSGTMYADGGAGNNAVFSRTILMPSATTLPTIYVAAGTMATVSSSNVYVGSTLTTTTQISAGIGATTLVTVSYYPPVISSGTLVLTLIPAPPPSVSGVVFTAGTTVATVS